MAQMNKHSALPLKAENKGSKMKTEELVNIFFSISVSFLQLILKTIYLPILKNVQFLMFEFAQQKGLVSWNLSEINSVIPKFFILF